MSDFNIKQNFSRYLIYALLTKAMFFLLFAYLFNKDANVKDNVNFIFTYSKDYKSYIEPAVNLVDYGTAYELSNEKKLFAHKMPGMLPIFVPLYYFFGLNGGLTSLVILQFLIDVLCCVLLAEIAYKIFNSKKAFIFTFWLYTLSSIVSVSSHFAVSELFCTSFSIIAIYFSVVKKGKPYLFLAGLFAAWSIFFRPTAILFLIIIPFIFLTKEDAKITRQLLWAKKQLILIFFVPFLFFESLWIIRNYNLMNRIIPAEISLENFGTPALKSVFSLIQAIGGDLQSWNPDSEMRWFNAPGRDSYSVSHSNPIPFPHYALNNGVNLERLKSIRLKYNEYSSDTLNVFERKELEHQIDILCKQAIMDFKSRAPFYYFVISPLRNLKTFLFIKRPYGFSFRNDGYLEKIIRGWHFVVYYFVLILFFIGIIVNFILKNKLLRLVLILCILHICLYGFILRYSENRYLVPIHPYLVISSTGAFMFIYSKVNYLRFKFKRI